MLATLITHYGLPAAVFLIRQRGIDVTCGHRGRCRVQFNSYVVFLGVSLVDSERVFTQCYVPLEGQHYRGARALCTANTTVFFEAEVAEQR